MTEFSGKVAVITGGSLGIGRAAAARLARAGAAVVICGYDQQSVTAALEDLRGLGLEVDGRRADVRFAEQLEQLVRHTVDRYGGLDILVNSAGVQRYGTVVDTSEEVWDEVLSTNLKGMFLAAKSCIPEMRRRGGGSIVNVASVQAFLAQRSAAAYVAGKGGAVALTRAIATDHADERIRCNAVCPGSVDTPMLRASARLFANGAQADELISRWGRMHPLGRVADCDEVAEVIAFLASDRSSFVTGAAYTVDGGLTAALPVELPEESNGPTA